MDTSEIALAEYWRIIRKRKGTIVLVFSAVVLSTFIFTKMQTPIYQSQLELKIEKQIPSGTPAEQIANLDTIAAINLTTEMRLIASLPVMQKV
ncbi:MAG: Wzz/FepE/Etk N-terminal domain-containing protein, partial [Candidatus Omnitrophica bacterium]|nr:Wzz/FepE/Etk N-terminal domain-containing protein [Candidatus Omnitrophota bacterium]